MSGLEIRHVATLIAAFALSGCTVVGSLPVITPGPVSILPGNIINVINATITSNGAPLATTLTAACEIDVQITPDGFEPLTLVAATRGGGTSFSCLIPPASSFAIRRNQTVRVRWQVFSPRPGQAPLKIAESPHKSVQLGCDDRAARLAEMQAAAFAALPSKITLVPPGSPPGTPAPPPKFTRDEIIGAGFVPTHGATLFNGMGVAFIRATSAGAGATATISGMDFDRPDVTRPDLLLFLPPIGTLTLTDASGFDEPYTLIGWAYAQTITAHKTPLPPTGAPSAIDLFPREQARPVLQCIAHHEWFIHAAGVHRFDGGFNVGPTAPTVAFPGTPAIPLPSIGLPHNALWDVHFFIVPGGTPEVGIVRRTGPPIGGGILFSPAAFFTPTAYDR